MAFTPPKYFCTRRGESYFRAYPFKTNPNGLPDANPANEVGHARGRGGDGPTPRWECNLCGWRTKYGRAREGLNQGLKDYRVHMEEKH